MIAEPVVLDASDLPGHAASWADGRQVFLPETLRTAVAESISPSGVLSLEALVAAVRPEDASALRDRCAFTARPPLSARLPFSYQRVPEWARTIAARSVGALGRRRLGRPSFPAWPLDVSVDILTDASSSASTGRANSLTPVLLTHDLDSAEGLSNLVRWFLPLEEAVGAHSTSYVVPKKFPLDYGLLDEVAGRGHELGIHGYDHSNTTSFAGDEERARRIRDGVKMLDRYKVDGYRAPSLLRTRPLLESLAGTYTYDSSIPTSGGIFPSPHNGCGTVRPYRCVGELAEIPITLPRDGSMRFLGFSPQEILEVWKKAALSAAECPGAVVCLLTHCEERFSGGEVMRRVYEDFLSFLADYRLFRFALARDIAAEVSGGSVDSAR